MIVTRVSKRLMSLKLEIEGIILNVDSKYALQVGFVPQGPPLPSNSTSSLGIL